MSLQFTPVLICDGTECTSRVVGQALRPVNVPRYSFSLLGELLEAWRHFASVLVMVGIFWHKVRQTEGWMVIRQGLLRRDLFYCPGCQARLRLRPVLTGLPPRP